MTGSSKAKGFVKEFKEFIAKGNVLGMAVGIIIGIAFGAVVTSMVNDVLMPPIGLALGGTDFSESYIVLKGAEVNGTEVTSFPSLDAAKAAGAVTLRWGLFVNTIINFLIIAFVIFLIVKAVAWVMRKDEEKKAETEKSCPFCDTKIPIKATRCPNCTSKLEEKTAAEA
ncbi:MAG: large conductance mechanosensitive channel protein MscL [Thermoplasmatota archaeon]